MAEKYPSGEKEKGRGGYTYVCIFTYDVSVEISYAIHAYSSLLNVCMKRKAKCGLKFEPINLLKDSLRFLVGKYVLHLSQVLLRLLHI